MKTKSTQNFDEAIKNIGVRIKEMRTALSMKQGPFSQLIGISQGTLSNIESGQTSPTSATIAAILMACPEVNARWLLTGEGSSTDVSIIKTSILDKCEFELVPLYDMKVSAGGGAEVSCETVKTQMAFRRYWLTQVMGLHAKDVALFLVMGDSMEPVICPGDIVLVNRAGVTPHQDGIYMIRQDNSLLVKRIQTLPGGEWMIISENKSYLPYKVRPGESPEFAVLGQVVWFGRKLVSNG